MPFCFTLLRATSLHNRTDSAEDKAFLKRQKRKKEGEARLIEKVNERDGERERELWKS